MGNHCVLWGKPQLQLPILPACPDILSGQRLGQGLATSPCPNAWHSRTLLWVWRL